MNVFKALRIPDLFSLLNAFFGLLAILAAGAGSPYVPVIFVFLSAAADGLDGLFARRFGSGVLGANLDSLADLISFGVAPAVLFLRIFGVPRLRSWWPWLTSPAEYFAWPGSTYPRAAATSRAFPSLPQG